MYRATLLTLLLSLAVPGASRAAATQLSYTLYILGVPLADGALSADLTASDYRVALGFHTIGVASLLAGSRLDDHVNGRFASDGPVPLEYGSNTWQHGEERTVGMTWRDGVPTVTAIAPPNETERETVPEALRARTVDPLSSVVLLLRLAARTGRCDGSARSYNGRRLQVFDVRTAGEEELPPSSHSRFSGRALRCDFTDRTLAGFRFGAGHDADARERRGSIWLARILADAPLLPVRIAIETPWFGDAMIYLTAATP